MAYEKTTWQTGDIVTAQKLNHLEQGVEGVEPLIIPLDNSSLGCTWQEIADAFISGRTCVLDVASASTVISIYCEQEQPSYEISFRGDGDDLVFQTDSPDGYPAEDEG